MTPFRDATPILEAEAAALHTRRRAELAATPRGHDSIFVRRSARIVAGQVGGIGAVFVLLVMLADVGHVAASVLAAVAAAFLAYPIAVARAARVLERRLDQALTRSGDPIADLDVLAAVGPRDVEHAMALENGHEAAAWPLVAATLLGPHTLHIVAAVTIGEPVVPAHIDDWIRFTSVLAAPVFAWGMVAAWRYPRRRAVMTDVGIATVVALVPGALLLGIPSLYVLVTGLVIAAAAYLPMGRVIDHETLTLAQRDPERPLVV